MTVIEFVHTEFAETDPQTVWQFWSNTSTWSEWDHGVEWCKLKEGHQFKLHGEALLLPKGAPFPLTICITECSPHESFTDKGDFDLGSIQFSHKVTPCSGGVQITHSLKFTPANPEAKEAFEMRMLPKIRQELPESVKTLAKSAEEKSRSQILAGNK